MVTRRVAVLLLRVAVRRWPVELRADLAREWAAELHELARTDRRWGMLRFAGSLAVSRVATPLADRAGARRLWRTAGVLLLAPPFCLAVLVFAGLTMGLAHGWLEMRVPWATAAQLPTWSGLTALLGVALALVVTRAARRTVRVGALPTALGVVLPVGATVTATLALLAGRGESRVWESAPGLLLWLALLTAALWAAGALARQGRFRAAWLVGLLGALVAADVAVVLAVVTSIPATAPVVDGMPPDSVDRISAPLWLFTCWTDSSFGLPRPTGWERFLITDRVLVEPMFYLACTPYALAYAIAAARPATAAVPGSEPVPAPA
ncbi:hypothetical protein ACLQ2Y_30680 [Micromonospora echinospora]|uniref:ABC-2 type transport system permease protein n=1 Tax=Micromonospora echinospora TaxID=1877 RepID=A0ABR6MJ67_MICEC|nr:hypothetical protein [Micromonospora echinospora]MBB5115425.1 hypothetical protein [Micromonospora echinospora]